MYVYQKSEPSLFTVGFFDPGGEWHPEKDLTSEEEAASRVAWLNGSRKVPGAPDLIEAPSASPRDPDREFWIRTFSACALQGLLAGEVTPYENAPGREGDLAFRAGIYGATLLGILEKDRRLSDSDGLDPALLLRRIRDLEAHLSPPIPPAGPALGFGPEAPCAKCGKPSGHPFYGPILCAECSAELIPEPGPAAPGGGS